MSGKHIEAHNRMQAEKAHAVKSMKAMARDHKANMEDSAANQRYLRCLIAALEIEIEELIRERDEARREWCRLWAHTDGRNLAPTQAARLRKWDCFKENTND